MIRLIRLVRSKVSIIGGFVGSRGRRSSTLLIIMMLLWTGWMRRDIGIKRIQRNGEERDQVFLLVHGTLNLFVLAGLVTSRN